jgi:hypothetical protein
MTREDKGEIVNGGLRDAWLAAGLEVPPAKRDPGNAARRAATPNEEKIGAAKLKALRRAEKRLRDSL